MTKTSQLSPALSPALFLDRDGVINIDKGYVHTPEATEFVEGIFELVRHANQQGYKVIIITNQAGIGRGYYTEEDFHKYMDWMRGEFDKEDAHIDAVYFCPHHATHGIGQYKTTCTHRKPAPGMILQAAKEHNIDLTRSIMLGDKESDMQAAEAAKIGKAVLFQGIIIKIDII